MTKNKMQSNKDLQALLKLYSPLQYLLPLITLNYYKYNVFFVLFSKKDQASHNIVNIGIGLK